MTQNRYQWARAGDVNAFFGLMLDNIAGLVLLVSMLHGIFGFPVDFALAYMVPGTAIGVLVGDLMFFGLAFIYAKRTGLTNVTAMPLGLDTPSTIGMVLLVLGPAYKAGLGEGLDPQAAAMQTWHIGMCAILISGLVKAALAPCSNWIHRVFPRAGLLGSLAAIALVLIAFTQMTELAANPLVGFGSLIIVLATLIARQGLPFKIPGALGAVMVGCAIWYLLIGIQSATGHELVEKAQSFEPVWFPTEWLSALSFQWLGSFDKALPFIGYIVPFAIATVIGGIDCAESAASVGDDFKTSRVIGIESIATIVAAVCGGVIQTTPYIGHPAYKAMGGRAAYTLATALFIGGAGLIGYFSWIFILIPKAAVLPILIFIGVEITAQSFHATPRRHYAALAVACLPAIAKLIMIYLGQFADVMDYDKVPPPVAANLQSLWLHLSVLSGGFILTSLIWASATAKIIDRRFSMAAVYLSVGGLFTLVGLMHSPFFGDKMFWPWQLFEESVTSQERTIVLEFVGAYLVMALLIFGLGVAMKDKIEIISTDQEYEKLV
jgi:AGZA family xanthine/uracil permease-like MFS transporter